MSFPHMLTNQSDIDESLHVVLCGATRDDGYRARLHGATQTENPWTEAGTLRAAWATGWMMAETDIRESRAKPYS